MVLQDNYNSATSLLSKLHWHPVSKWINSKIATLVYQSLAFGQPTYLSSVLTPHQPEWSLRSVYQNLLCVPRCNSSFGERSFSYCAPKIWNDIQLSVRQSPSLDSFKRNLKTHYFANKLPPGDWLQRLWFDILDIVRFTNRYECMNEWMILKEEKAIKCCLAQKTLPLPHYRVLPPGEFNGIISESLHVCCESFVATPETCCQYCC